MSLSTIILNGKSFLGRALRIEQRGDVFIDGKRIELERSPKIDIVVHGNLDSLEVGAANSIAVQGSAGRVSTGSGDVKCGAVTGDVSTGSGGVECGAVQGNISTGSGDVQCGKVNGSIKTMSGDVNIR